MVAEGSDSPLLVDLAGTMQEDLSAVKEILGKVEVHPASSGELRRKWVWLLMSWLYEHQNEEADVFETIGQLYADLGYPPEMARFGPYAPASQAKGDPQEARRRSMPAILPVHVHCSICSTSSSAQRLSWFFAPSPMHWRNL